METEFLEQQKRMVEVDLAGRNIKDPRVLEAFLQVPRHEFVPLAFVKEAYADYPLQIGESQTISQPYVVAVMTQAAGIKSSDRVLEVGTGSGYQAAILSMLCQGVYTIERFENLAKIAAERLERLGYRNVRVKVGDGSIGWAEFAPFDAIIVTAGAAKTPPSLVGQLKEGGRLVIPLGDRFFQELFRFTKREDKLLAENLGGVRFVPLVGKEGWGSETF